MTNLAKTSEIIEKVLRQFMEEKFEREWVGLTDEEIKDILDCGRGGLVDIKKAEQILRERNT